MKTNRKSKSLQKIILNKNIINYNNKKKEKASLEDNTKNISLAKKIIIKKENININILNNIIQENNEQKFSEIIKKDKSIINQLISNGMTLLHILVIKQKKNLIEILLKNGADVNIISLKNRRTALHLAYIYQKNESNDIINLLKEYGAKDDILDNNKKPSEYYKYKEKKEKNLGGENKLKKIKIKKEKRNEGYKGNIYNLKDSNDNTFVVITMDNISYLTSDQNTINQMSDLTITKNNSININNTLNDSLDEEINNSLYDSLEMEDKEIKKTPEKNNNKIIADINMINTSENMDSLFTTLITNKRNSYINSGKIRASFKTEERNTISSHNEYTENSTFKIINNEKKTDRKISAYNSAISTLSQTNKKNNRIENDEIINYNEINQNCSFLLKWLIDIGLSDYYENFLNNKIYDINRLIEQMKSPNDKLDLEDIENILGIHNPGHIFRILIKLEIDGNIIDKKIVEFMLGNNNINKKLIFSSDEKYICDNLCTVNKVNLNFCGIKNINIFSKKKNDLESFLYRYNLNNLYQNFSHNGFDQINYVILQMYSSFPINLDILENYFHIYDEEQRKLTLEAIKKEIMKINNFINSENYLNNKNKDLIKYENIDFSQDDENNTNNIGCYLF